MSNGTPYRESRTAAHQPVWGSSEPPRPGFVYNPPAREPADERYPLLASGEPRLARRYAYPSLSAPPPDQGWPTHHSPEAPQLPWPLPTLAPEPIPAHREPDPGPARHDPTAADLRRQVAQRMRLMNHRHAEHAWERRHRDPIGPHGLAFLFSEPDTGKRNRRALRSATRLFLDGPDVTDLPRLLYDLAKVVHQQRDAGSADPLALADRSETMSAAAAYVGIGVSSLDTPHGTWQQTRHTITNSLDIPGRCYALLADGTFLLLDRGGEDRFTELTIRSTRSLDVRPGQPSVRWQFDSALAALSDPDTRRTWQRLQQLHDSLLGMDTGDH